MKTIEQIRLVASRLWAARSPMSITCALVLLVMGLIGFLPLFDGPGYESALAAGIVLPSVCAIATALEMSRKRLAPIDAFSKGVANGSLLIGIAWLVTMAHGLRSGFCDPWGGSVFYAFGPGVGAMLAGGWGAVAGEFAGRVKRRRLVAVLLALAAPIASVLVALVRFYTSPMVFAYDPFVGYFSGSFYDTIIDFSGLYTYRVGTVATLAAAAVVALHLERTKSGKLVFRFLGRPGLLVLGIGCAIASLSLNIYGYRFGHWHTAGTIKAQLAAPVAVGRCDVFAARGIPRADVERFARECDAHVIEQEAWLEMKGPERLSAYLFADSAQKGSLMGAADTYIAKPWRKEVYLQQNGFPHPVLGHEIAHVMAGAFARGPFSVAGNLAGLWPNPGLIEGIAVATSPHEGALSPREWARAMKDLKLLPRLERLFALGFYGENSTVAYTASGAFVGFVKERHGAGAVRAWYGGGSLPEITGLSWESLEKAFLDDLEGVSLPDAAMAQAKARFDRPGLFSRRCPHIVDACRRRADEQRNRGDDEGVMETVEQWMTLDSGDAGARVALARTLVRLGKVDEGKAALEAIVAEERFTRYVRDRALDELADLALSNGETERATTLYREVMSRSLDENELRTLDVKLEAARNPRARQAIVALLIGTGGRGPDRVRAAEALSVWAATNAEDGLADYLLARGSINAMQFEEAAGRLDKAMARGLPLTRVAAEAERLRLVAACAIADAPTVERMALAYIARPEVFFARREASAKFASRCIGKTIRVDSNAVQKAKEGTP